MKTWFFLLVCCLFQANMFGQNVIEEQFAENQRTMVLFKELFNFCPVYFFYANQTKQVLAGNITGNLLNDALQPDTSIHLFTDNFYIASV